MNNLTFWLRIAITFPQMIEKYKTLKHGPIKRAHQTMHQQAKVDV